jgi:hypothetical protein
MKIVYNQLKAIKVFISYFALKNRVEKILFFFFFFFLLFVQIRYFPFLLDNTKILGYDPYMLQWISSPSTNFATIKHPLINFYLLPLSLLLFIAKFIISEKAALVSLYVFYHLSVTYSMIFIYRILNELMMLNQFRSIILTILFSSFAHIIIQSFIIESYPLSLLLLTITLYVLGKGIYLKEKTDPYLYCLLFVLTAGVTITNGLKTIIAYLFTEKKLNAKIKWIVAVSFFFLILVAIIYIPTKLITSKNSKTELVSNNNSRPGYSTENPKQSLTQELEASGSKIPFLKFIRFDIDLFSSFRGNILGESALFHTSNFKSEIRNGRNIYLEYSSPYKNWIILLFYLFFVFSVIISLNQKFSHILLAFLSVDIFIHVVCRFGIEEPYIFAAHWMFLIPLFFAFLYKNERLKNLYYFFDLAIISFSIFFLYNNWSIIFEFLVINSSI